MPEYALGKLRGKFAVVYRDGAGKRHRHSLGTADIREAARRLTEFEKKHNEIVREVLTVGQLWDRYKAYLGTRPAAKTMGYEWRSMEATFGHLYPGGVTEAVVLAYTEMRRATIKKGKPIKDGTIWTELGRLRMVFVWAKKKSLITEAPHIERPAPAMPRSLYLTREQMQAFLGFCGAPHVTLFAILAWTTGARSAALLDLTWDRIDFERGRIRLSAGDFDPSKPVKGRAVVPMNGTARAALIEAKKGARSPYVIEWANAKVGSIKRAIKRAAIAAGVPWVSPHVFRHSAAVMMAENRVPMSEIAQFLGHTNTKMTEKVYAVYSPDYLQDAASSLELAPVLKIVR